MITSTDKHAYPNTLIVILGQDKGKSHYEEKGQVTRVSDEDSKATGSNFFNIDQYLNYDALNNGEVGSTAEDLIKLDQVLTDNGPSDQLRPLKPTLVHSYVKTCEVHPGSDHLYITAVDVGLDDDVKIVCSASNTEVGQKAVVALPGTLVPNDARIWPGELCGVPSYGTICLARELGLAHTPQKRGIMAVPDNFEAGQEFEPARRDGLLASGVITL